MNTDTTWVRCLAKATFDVLIPLLNTVAPDLGRVKSLILKVPILVERHLMSTPTYASSSYMVKDGVIHIPELFPIANKSIKEWSTLISVDTTLCTILSLPKLKSIVDANQPTASVESSEVFEVSEDETEDEDKEWEASLEMIDSIPASIIDNATQYETSV